MYGTFLNSTEEITTMWQQSYHSCPTIPLVEPVHQFLVVHSFEDIPVSGTISLFEHLQILDNIQNNIIKLKRRDEQIIYFCNELDKCHNTEHQSLSIKLHHKAYSSCEKSLNNYTNLLIIYKHTGVTHTCLLTLQHMSINRVAYSENDTKTNPERYITESIKHKEWCNSWSKR